MKQILSIFYISSSNLRLCAHPLQDYQNMEGYKNKYIFMIKTPL